MCTRTTNEQEQDQSGDQPEDQAGLGHVDHADRLEIEASGREGRRARKTT